MRPIVVCCLVSALLIPIPTIAAASPTDAPAPAALHVLFAEYDAWIAQESPERAMERGDYTSAERLSDQSLAAIESRRAWSQAFLDRLLMVPRESLDETDALSADLLGRALRESIADDGFRTFLMPVGGRWGPHQIVAGMHERVRFANERDYASYCARLEQVPAMLEQIVERLRIGVAEGRTPPQVALVDIPDQLAALLGLGTTSPAEAGDRPADGRHSAVGGIRVLATPFDRMPATIDAATAEALRRRFEGTSMPAVVDSLRRYRDHLVNEYLPRCRESIAATALPDGERYYEHCLRTHTTTGLNAREIHEIGLNEVSRIRAEMLHVIRRTDFVDLNPGAETLDDESLFRAFIASLRTDPRFYHTTEAELLDGYRSICKRIDGWLPRMFRVLPRLPYGVKPIPRFMAASQTTAYYQPGDLRNGEAGFFCANTFRLDMRPKYEMVALSLHEAVPGHHLQISLAKELDGLPEFRRQSRINAFVEGWALYAERLGIENGMYLDPYDDFGRLLYEMWRACRLVVDPGMHALGWSREQAMAFLRENTALSELNIRNEIDRYIGWPGQACGYKLGELAIRALRAEAELRLGANFDIRAFHDAVLGAGAVPLDVLEARVRRWMEASAG